MKNYQMNEATSQMPCEKHTNTVCIESIISEDEKMFQHLQEIEAEIKNPLTREKGYAKLLEIDVEGLSVGLKIYYLFIRGKYFTKKYRLSKTKEIALLEYANDFFDDAVHLAKKEKVTIKSARILFLRTHTKYMIGLNHKSAVVREQFISKSKFLVEMSLRHFENNSSFLYLKAELSKH